MVQHGPRVSPIIIIIFVIIFISLIIIIIIVEIWNFTASWRCALCHGVQYDCIACTVARQGGLEICLRWCCKEETYRQSATTKAHRKN